MNNGEEEAGEIFSDFASPDPLDEWRGDQGLDSGNASPISTENSFYDDESEFERYCSANSVMGSASICSSSNDFLDSDLGSFKSFKFDDFGSGGIISRRNSGGDRSVRNRVPNATAASRVSGEEDRLKLVLGNENLVNLKEFSDEGNMLNLGSESHSLKMVENWVPNASGVSGEEDRLKLVLGNENLVNLKEFSGEGNMLNLGSESHSLKMVVCEDNGRGDVGSSHRLHSVVSRDLFSGSETGSMIEEEEEEDNMLNLGSKSHSLLGSSNAPLKMIVCEDNGSEHVQDDVGSSHRVHSVSRDLFGGSETGSVIEEEEEEEGRSSKCERSDDEGSMYGICTDDEENVELGHRRNLQFHRVPETEIGNPLFMNSAVAFGADDWNDFEQENEGNDGLASTMWIKPQEQQQELHAPVAHAGGSTLVALEEEENARDVPAAISQVHGIVDSTKDPKSVSMNNILTMKDPLMLQTPRNKNLNIMDGVTERELQGFGNEENLGLDGTGFSSSENSILHLDPLSDLTVNKVCSSATEGLRGKDESFDKSNELPPMIGKNQEIGVNRMVKDSPVSASLMNNHVAPIEVENPEVNDSFDEFVLEMEEILLDSKESHGARFPQGNRASLLQLPHPFRDGSSTASTSGTDDVYPPIQHQLKINGVEVIGAKQIQGDVSFGERLVGVKEYTVYKLRVWSASDQWEVERRYRDFFALYSQLKRLFAAHGWSLPSPWSRVEQESRKIFGNASPGVVSDRSALIQECLRSILHSDSLYSTPTSLICFLSPQKSVSSSFTISEPVPPSPSEFNQGTCRENISSLGQTISLVVEIHPRKSLKQLLEAQHYTCAGCHTHLDAEKTLMQEFVQTFGWGKPRVCDYTGQLFCASCHTNDIAVLPARVLHLWDFTQYPVSQFAKSYLDATYDQPMLCVSAVNPFLFSKVPTLLHVMGIRKKIGAMLPYVRCPFRRSVNKGLGSRRYLLESNDFFALRDLVDLSKGAFAVLPVKLETVSMKILEHITQQCLVCCDAGVPCGARQACEDTSSLIFPFQEGEIDRCTSCDLVYHKPCFKKLTGCLCGGTSLEGAKIAHKAAQLKWKSKTEVNESLDVSARPPNSETTVGFLSSLFTRSRPGKTWGSRKSSPVILMGSLPSNSL